MTDQEVTRTCRTRRLTMIIMAGGACDPHRLADEIVRLAYANGLPLAATFSGVTGYRLTTGIEEYCTTPPLGGAPAMVVIAGDAEAIDDFVTGVARAVPDALILLDDVTEIVRTVPDLAH
ncbi:DUF190 domain-containing protein [Pseudonocardia sp. GCM10023141]|uniref:DUF190 domain-containing protein n=1 Tax=Pseudonocardia sp. GCM10023141 TaxID=3252653 RepID=UPI00360B6189